MNAQEIQNFAAQLRTSIQANRLNIINQEAEFVSTEEAALKAVKAVDAAMSGVKKLNMPFNFVGSVDKHFYFDATNLTTAGQAGRALAMYTAGKWMIEYEWRKGEQVEADIPTSTAIGSEMEVVYVLWDMEHNRHVAACVARNQKGNPVAEVYEQKNGEWLYHPITHKVRTATFKDATKGSYVIAYTKFHMLARLIRDGQRVNLLMSPRSHAAVWNAYTRETWIIDGNDWREFPTESEAATEEWTPAELGA